MTTTLSEVSDLFLSRVDDYTLTNIYNSSGSVAFNIYLEPWLLDSIIEFNEICTQDLTYVPCSGLIEGYFSEDLTLENKIILSQLMVIAWLAKTIQNLTQISNFITDRDFKTFSAAQNLSAKKDLYNAKREEVSQILTNYGYRHNSWSNWQNQNFGT